MNLPQFLKQVDAEAEKMSRQELEVLVHEVARTLPEGKRDAFLDMIHIAQGQDETGMSKSDQMYVDDFVSEEKRMISILEKINQGERNLDSEYNEEWDDWYNPDVDEVLFSDPDQLLPDIQAGINLVHKAVDLEEYIVGCELAEALSVLEVFSEGDYNDFSGSPLSISELYEYGLLDGSFEILVRESMFLAYMGNEPDVRAEEMFCMASNYQCYDVSLEQVMQIGKHDLPDFKSFLPQWIDYLGSQSGRGVKKLLEEACSMIGDDECMLETARKFSGSHPELYLQILQSGAGNGEEERYFSIGMEAMERLPESWLIRSRIALLMAGYACLRQDEMAMEKCWLEAFRSNTSVVNYMRLRFCTKDYLRYRDQMQQIYHAIYRQKKERGYDANAQGENSLHDKTYHILSFFDEKFDFVKENGMKEKSALGWSCTFMKEGLALFLMLMYEGDALQKGIISMLWRAVRACDFHIATYLEGTEQKIEGDDQTLFWDLFCRWKADVNAPEEKMEQWLTWMKDLVELRVEGIMQGNHRKYYGECASYIAAIGEVEESRGTRGAKAALMEYYKMKYSRRRAFHQELREYGMKS